MVQAPVRLAPEPLRRQRRLPLRPTMLYWIASRELPLIRFDLHPGTELQILQVKA
jgi:hypothetical protein